MQLNLFNNSSLEFKVEDVFKFQDSQFFLNKIVNLPNDRIFVIGGAEDFNCKKAFNTVFELQLNNSTNNYELVPKANMLLARAAFGCVVYPNFT